MTADAKGGGKNPDVLVLGTKMREIQMDKEREDVFEDYEGRGAGEPSLYHTAEQLDRDFPIPSPIHSSVQVFDTGHEDLNNQVIGAMHEARGKLIFGFPEPYYSLCWEALSVVLYPSDVREWEEAEEHLKHRFRTFINEVKRP